MTRIAFIADVHVGNHRRHGGASVGSLNERCRETLGVLSAAADHAQRSNCEALVVCGDLLDKSRPPARMIVETIRALRRPDMLVVLLVGNHEQQSTHDDDHALAPFAEVPGFRVVQHPEVVSVGSVDLLCVPFVPGAALRWFPSAVHDLRSRMRDSASGVLAFHLGVQDDETAHFLKDAHDSIAAETVRALCMDHAPKICTAFAGNWHDRRQWGPAPFHLLQLGALVPTGWSNPGLRGYGTVAVWSPPDQLDVVELPGPRFVKRPPQASEVPNGCRVLVDDIPEVTSADIVKGAADAARERTTITDAVGAFIDGMRLPDGVSRAGVRARVLRYLGGVDAS